MKQGGISVRITKEAIESFPEQVAQGPALPMTIDHDPFALPLGKIEEAWVEPYGNEYAVVVRVSVEDAPSVVRRLSHKWAPVLK